MRTFPFVAVALVVAFVFVRAWLRNDLAAPLPAWGPRIGACDFPPCQPFGTLTAGALRRLAADPNSDRILGPELEAIGRRNALSDLSGGSLEGTWPRLGDPLRVVHSVGTRKPISRELFGWPIAWVERVRSRTIDASGTVLWEYAHGPRFRWRQVTVLLVAAGLGWLAVRQTRALSVAFRAARSKRMAASPGSASAPRPPVEAGPETGDPVARRARRIVVAAALLLGVVLLVGSQWLVRHSEHSLGGSGTAFATSLDLDAVGRAASGGDGTTLARAMAAALPDSVPDADPVGVVFGARTRVFGAEAFERHGVFQVEGHRTELGLTGRSLRVSRLTRNDGGDPRGAAPRPEHFGPVAHRALVHSGRIEIVLGAGAGSPRRIVLSIDPVSLARDAALVVVIALVAHGIARGMRSWMIDDRVRRSCCAACGMDLSAQHRRM